MAKAFTAKDDVAFSRPGAKATMFLPNRYRFVVVVAGQVPTILPITESANWEVDIPPEVEATVTEWPVLVLVLPKKHAALFEKLKPEMAADMIRQARSAVSSGLN